MPKAPKSVVTKLDLTLESHQNLVLQWIADPKVKAVLLAPPCGTSSAARNIQLDDEDNLPMPLRSWDEPDGILGLEGSDFMRVAAANILYDFIARVYDLCCALNKPCIVENPRSSLFWCVTPWRDRQFSHCDVVQDHQACAYGSCRPKWTRLIANFEQVQTINLVCDMKHKHEEWGVVSKGAKRVFATSLEVHYPSKLCEAIVHAFVLRLQELHVDIPTPQPITAMAQAFTGVQPTSAKLPALIPEFRSRFALLLQCDICVWPAPSPCCKQAKLLHSFNLGEFDGDVELLSSEFAAACQTVHLDVKPVLASFTEARGTFKCDIYGQCWTPEEFVQQACQAVHPMAAERVLPPQLIDVVNFHVKHSPDHVAKVRADFISKWTKRALQLQSVEDKTRESMDEHLARALKGKRIELFREMLLATEFPDVQVCDELLKGADLTGDIPCANMLPPKFSPALCTENMLRQKAALTRNQVLADCQSSGDRDLDNTVWTKTQEETEKGWLLGPFDPKEVPTSAPLSRRFGLVQKHGKIRLIDDFSESSVNSAVSVCESPVLHTVDVAASLLVLWFRECRNAGIHPELHVRTFDLSSAYRQIGLSKHGREFSFIRVFDPTCNAPRLFQGTVLPFGAVRSVHSFLRCARALWWIGVVGCKLLWTSFYDDFICVSQLPLCNCAELTVIALFKLLGWAFAESGDKCVPFGCHAEALGVLFNLKDSCQGAAFVTNTEKRIDELCAEIQSVLDSGKLMRKHAQRLRGRMLFADAQIYGRTGRRCLAVLGAFAEGKKVALSHKDRLFLGLFRNLLRSNVPRELCAPSNSNVVMFTDACYEIDSRDIVCGVGGVLHAPCGSKQFFSLALTAEQCRSLGSERKKQLIFEAETLAALIAVKVWSSFMSNQKCLLFVDNEGTKFSLLKGFNENVIVDKLAELFVCLESELHSYTWLCRVPSLSNVADAPSRGDLTWVTQHGSVDVSSQAASVLDDVLSCLKLG